MNNKSEKTTKKTTGHGSLAALDARLRRIGHNEPEIQAATLTRSDAEKRMAARLALSAKRAKAGSLGGKAARGKKKARATARQAILARWANRRKPEPEHSLPFLQKVQSAVLKRTGERIELSFHSLRFERPRGPIFIGKDGMLYHAKELRGFSECLPVPVQSQTPAG